jgi:hypothetical protein
MSTSELSPLHIVYFESGAETGCVSCGKTIDRGQFCVILTDGEDTYILSKRITMSCCGQSTVIYKLFETIKEAEDEKRDLQKMMTQGNPDPDMALVLAPPNIIETPRASRVLH